MKPSSLNPIIFVALLAQLAFAEQSENKQAQYNQQWNGQTGQVITPDLMKQINEQKRRQNQEVQRDSGRGRPMSVKEYMKVNNIESPIEGQ